MKLKIVERKVKEDRSIEYQSKTLRVNQAVKITERLGVQFTTLFDNGETTLGEIEFMWKNKESSEQAEGKRITKLELRDSDGELVTDLLKEILELRKEQVRQKIGWSF